jgi:glycosyltransferase involved in cell wall biosynthesis
MMFQLFTDMLVEMGEKVSVFDIGGRKNSAAILRASGTFHWKRVADYCRVLPKIWKSLIGNRSVVYLVTAPSLWGFLRDSAIIWPAFLLGHSIVTHQFGGKYREFYEKQFSLIKSFIKGTLSHVDSIIVEGESIKRQFSFLSDWESKVRPIPDGLPERGAAFPSTHKFIDPDQPLNILYLSNLIETKGYWDVLEAIHILVNERRRNVHCEFVGRFLPAKDSVRFPNVEIAQREFVEFVESHDLAESVSHVDFLFGNSKANAFQRSHIFVLPSNYANEGQPTAILEAMAYGLVVISTEYRLIPSMVVDQRTGFFVRYGHPEDIADRIEFLLDNPEVYECMSQNSIKRFQNKFTGEQYVTSLLEVVREVE